MSDHSNHDHVLYQLFGDFVSEALYRHVSSTGQEDVATYLAELLAGFLHTDRIFGLRNKEGKQLVSIAEMVAEGDMRLGADSFDREREVHKHIGDFILFWSGIYPEFLKQLKLRMSGDLICDYVRQGQESYRLVSTFDHSPYDVEAPTFRKLSGGFEDYAFCLAAVRDRLQLPPMAC
jgi:hypothetical protein